MLWLCLLKLIFLLNILIILIVFNIKIFNIFILICYKIVLKLYIWIYKIIIFKPTLKYCWYRMLYKYFEYKFINLYIYNFKIKFE